MVGVGREELPRLLDHEVVEALLEESRDVVVLLVRGVLARGGRRRLLQRERSARRGEEAEPDHSEARDEGALERHVRSLSADERRRTAPLRTTRRVWRRR